ncbi:MAG: hypothetical protein RLZZ67_454 [Candidatus Parcubacteria bacterium]|jgi:hypothetical protein
MKISLIVGVLSSILFLLGGLIGGVFTTISIPLFYICLPVILLLGGVSTQSYGVLTVCVLWIIFLSWLVGLVVRKIKRQASPVS